jgi:GT2 family glycosyltransferase
MIGDIPFPAISVLIVNYNGAAWMRACLESIKQQTVFAQIEVIVIDNASSDRSDVLAQELLRDWTNSSFIQTGSNLGFSAAANRGVATARGQYLFFLNPDVWLETGCLEELLVNTARAGASAGSVVMLNYEDDSFQGIGGSGFDLFGLGVQARRNRLPRHLFISGGFFFVRADVFRTVGGFDESYFLYAEEADLSWRIWISGGRIISVPGAIIHHRGAASVNPEGGTRIVELRTSESKRYYANRNNLLSLLKNCQHILLALVVTNVLFLAVETIAGLLVVRRLSFVRTTFINALRDCWRVRAHIASERAKVAVLRRRSDFYMLRFFTLRLSHWDDLVRVFKLGLPRVDK